MITTVNIKDFFGLSVLCIGLISTSTISVVSEGTPLIEQLGETTGAEEIFGKMVLENEKPLFGQPEIGDEKNNKPRSVFKKILLQNQAKSESLIAKSIAMVGANETLANPETKSRTPSATKGHKTAPLNLDTTKNVISD